MSKNAQLTEGFSELAREYKILGEEEKRIKEQRRRLKTKILSIMGTVGESSLLTDDGIKITVFAKQIKQLPFPKFKELATNTGLEHIYSICNIVQNRLTGTEKDMLEVVGEQAKEIRVTLPVGE